MNGQAPLQAFQWNKTSLVSCPPTFAQNPTTCESATAATTTAADVTMPTILRLMLIYPTPPPPARATYLAMH